MINIRNFKIRDKKTELIKAFDTNDNTKSRDPSTFCVNVKSTASVFSSGNVAFKTGIIFMQKISTSRKKELSIMVNKLIIK